MKLEGHARDAMILDILKGIDEADSVSGPSKRFNVWDDTWKASVEALKVANFDTKALIPRYFTQHEPYRIGGEFYSSDEGWEVLKHTEYLRQKLFKTWLRDAEQIDEFGAGSGWNIVWLAQNGWTCKLRGHDWTDRTREIFSLLNERYGFHLESLCRNMFKCKPVQLDKSHVVTWGSMEQLGRNFHDFVDFLIESRPKLVLNVEPIMEFYDLNNISDWLCWKYHTKRGYLAGFLPYLKKLEKDGVIAIDTIHRERFCGKYHEALSHIVWRPI